MTQPQDRILIVDDEPLVLEFLSDVLTREGFTVSQASRAQQALDLLASEPHGLILCDIRMPGMDGYELLKSVVRHNPGTDVILMTGYGSVDGALDALTLGAADYLIKPLKPKEIVARIRACLERRRLELQVQALSSELRSRYDRRNVVAESPRMAAVVAALHRVAPLDQPLLLCGEPGSGRHFLARVIHHASPRRAQRLAEVDCDRTSPARVQELIFGKAGGGGRRSAGQLERLARGTLHLSRIERLPPEVQGVLGRCLSTRAFRPQGDERDQPLEARLILSCARTPKELLAAGRLDSELSAVCELSTLNVPPLRERAEDLPGLVQVFAHEFTVEHGRTLEVPPEAVETLQGADFPGNVTQLFGILAHAAALSADGVLSSELMLRALDHARDGAAPVGSIADRLDEREYELVLRAVQRFPRRLDEAARALGVSRTTLWRRMRKYGIRLPTYQGSRPSKD